jgi:hypothetical protein
MSLHTVKFLPLVIALLLLFTLLPVESQSIFEIRDKDVMQTLLGPFSHFFMPLLGFYPLRSFLLAPYYIIEDWISSSWPIGALIMLIFTSDISTINAAVEDLKESFGYRALRHLYNLLPARLHSAITMVMLAIFSSLSALLTPLVFCAGLIADLVPESAISLLNLIFLIAFSFWWFVPAVLIIFIPFIRPLYLRVASFLLSLPYEHIPGLRALYTSFMEQMTGIPVIRALY